MLWLLPLILLVNKCTTRRHLSTRGCFMEVPTEIVWVLVSVMCQWAPGGSERCPGPWHFEMPLFLWGFWGASWSWLEYHNRWPTGHPRCGLLVPSPCHICFAPAAMTSWRLLSQSHHHGYKIPNVGNRPQCTNSLPAAFKAWLETQPKLAAGYYIISVHTLIILWVTTNHNFSLIFRFHISEIIGTTR